MPLFTLSSLTCHRFIITSITVSSKGLCDAFCPNNLYAKVGGISVTELNVLEREFLAMIDWRLMVSRKPAPHLTSSLKYLLALAFFFPPSLVYKRNLARILRQPRPNAQRRKIRTLRYTYAFQLFRERR